MKTLLFTLLLGFGLLLQPAEAKKRDNSNKYTPEQLAEVVQARLSTLDQGVALWVKGMICESCGIGIRKKVGKLDFVDQDQLKKGVEMDVEHMLLYIATKQGASVNPEELSKAIKKAGYLPVSYFSFVDGSLVRSDIE